MSPLVTIALSLSLLLAILALVAGLVSAARAAPTFTQSYHPPPPKGGPPRHRPRPTTKEER